MSNKIIQANNYIENNRNAVNPRYRGKYHAMPPVGWMNDPNGFNYALGNYHLFYQYHPYSAQWGPMHWGHFVSGDLITWNEQPVAIAPDTPYDESGCFSGSSFEKDGKLYLMYTSVSGERQTQALAVSDDSVEFKKLGQVITTEQIPSDSSLTDFRDPKLFEENGVYYSLIGAKDADGKGHILSYKSADLKNWEYLGKVIKDERAHVCECPDYFKLDGKEVLLYSPQFVATDGIKYQNQHSNVYAIGKLNLHTGEFEKTAEGEIDSGCDFYAAQTLKTPDGRRVLIAWMSMWDRTLVTAPDGYSGAMTLPRELSVIDGKLYQNPVREIEKYRSIHYHIEKKDLLETLQLPNFGATQEVSVTFEIGTAKKVGLKLFCGNEHETLVYYDVQKNCVVFDRSKMGKELKHGQNEADAYVRYGNVTVKDGKLTMRLFLDVSSCEVFFGDGECVMTANIYADKDDTNNYLFVEDGLSKIQKLDVYSLEINKNSLEERK